MKLGNASANFVITQFKSIFSKQNQLGFRDHKETSYTFIDIIHKKHYIKQKHYTKINEIIELEQSIKNLFTQ